MTTLGATLSTTEIPSILDRSLTQVDVANTDVETSLYSFTIPANTLGATGGVRLHVGGDMLRNVTGSFLLRLKLGATLIVNSAATSFTSSANRYKWTFDAVIMNASATSQKCSARWGLVSSTAPLAGQLGNSNLLALFEGLGSSAENTAANLVLDLTAHWFSADVNLSFRKELAILELIPAS